MTLKEWLNAYLTPVVAILTFVVALVVGGTQFNFSRKQTKIAARQTAILEEQTKILAAQQDQEYARAFALANMAVKILVRIYDRIAERATHHIAGDLPDGGKKLDFDPEVLVVLSDYPIIWDDDQVLSAFATVYPNYTKHVAGAIGAYRALLVIVHEAKSTPWPQGVQRQIPWDHESTKEMKQRMDDAISRLFVHGMKLCDINRTLWD
ncbi:hypothetical protein AB9E29_10875 [Rhizobium leguminosarum]|uniref:hypothetical protein n=1 Tax=Rhizobium leguminosarum TaxID=384 RepID=UPI003F95B78D